MCSARCRTNVKPDFISGVIGDARLVKTGAPKFLGPSVPRLHAPLHYQLAAANHLGSEAANKTQLKQKNRNRWPKNVCFVSKKRAGKWDWKAVTFSGPLLNAVIETRPGNRAQKPHRFLDKFCTGSRLLYVEPSSHTVRKPSACKATPAQNLHVLLAATCPLSGCCVEAPSMCQPAQADTCLR